MNHRLIGQILRKLRKKRDLTQEQAAAALGVSQPHLSRVERGYKKLPVDKLSSFCDFYGVSVVDVVAACVSGGANGKV